MKWEYLRIDQKRIKERTAREQERFFNSLGDDDWELVVIDNLDNFYFKRPKDESA